MSPTSTVNILFLHPFISTFAMLKRRFSIRPRPTGSFRRFAANSEERNFWTKFDSREFSRETFEASAILFREKPPENLLEAQELLREVGSQSGIDSFRLLASTCNPNRINQVNLIHQNPEQAADEPLGQMTVRCEHDATRCDTMRIPS